MPNDMRMMIDDDANCLLLFLFRSVVRDGFSFELRVEFNRFNLKTCLLKQFMIEQV